MTRGLHERGRGLEVSVIMEMEGKSGTPAYKMPVSNILYYNRMAPRCQGFTDADARARKAI